MTIAQPEPAAQPGPGVADAPGEMACQELVELVTDYLEGALTPAQLARFEAHLLECDDCPMYIDQLRATIRLAGRLTEADVSPGGREALLTHFRAWSSSRA